MHIETNVPVEPSKRHEWPFKVMQVGESVLVHAALVNKAISSARMHGLRYGKSFITRMQPDRSVRIWRAK